MTKVAELHKKWLADPEYQNAYEAQRTEFEDASEVIIARRSFDQLQSESAQVAEVMQTHYHKRINQLAKPMTAPILDAESSLTNRYQTTVPAPVRAALGLEKGDRIQYEILSGGQVVISKASASDADPVLERFLDFIAQDIQTNPGNIKPLSHAFRDKINALTDGVEIDLDEPLNDEDD